jgi:2-oxoglutarate dehydrogenase E2 component (dihydrolipoamide succinyltransferase)
MPQLGETVIEGTITKWLKQEGETVERDEPLFEISTDKVDTEVPSPFAGTLTQIKVQEGQTVSVGTELATIDAGDAQPGGQSPAQPQEQSDAQPNGQAPAGAEATPPAAGPSEIPAPAAAPSETPAPAGDATNAGATTEAAEAAPETPAAAPPAPAAPAAPATAPATQAPAAASASPAPPSAAPAPATTATLPDRGERSQILSPVVRRLAHEHSIDLAQVHGTGTGGRITRKDVLAFIESGGTAAAAAPAPAAAAAPAEAAPAPTVTQIPQAVPAEPAPAQAPAAAAPAAPQAVAPSGAQTGEEIVPLSRMRQSIATHMHASLQATARAWNLVEVDMENVVRVRAAAKDAFAAREGFNLTFMPFVARAVCDALLAYPDVNSELREDQLVRKLHVNLGIAVALDDGLIVPVVKGADSMNLVGVARAINDVATRARGKKLTPDDVHGGTFTITNPGPYGSLISVPIINTPECAILAFDTIEKRPVVVDDAIAIRHMVYLSMSWDHRIIDGATAAQFLSRLKGNLETWDFGPEAGLPARS